MENQPPKIPEPTDGAPFILEHRVRAPRPDGNFTPEAAVLLAAPLRESGLLAALDPEDLQTLVFVLSCAGPNGGFIATAEIASAVFGISAASALARLRRLAASVWRGEPLLYEQATGNGLRLFVPAAHLFQSRQVEVWTPGTTRPGQVPPVTTGSREAVLAHSRAAYGRPRAEVEAEIERFLLNEPEPATPEEAARLLLRRRLLRAGLAIEQAERLLADYPPEEIECQLEWLPYRHARNPAGYLVAAIEGGYEAPLALRRDTQAAASASGEPEAGTTEAEIAEAVPAEAVAAGMDGDIPTVDFRDSAPAEPRQESRGAETDAP